MGKRTKTDAYGVLEPKTGDVKLFNREKFRSDLKDMSDETERVPIKLTLRRVDVTISAKQRRYFYGVVATRIEKRLNELGNRVDKDKVVFFLKENFLYRMVMEPISGKVIKKHISLSESDDEPLTKEEFQRHKEEIQQWAIQQIDLNIPDPNENEQASEHD
jgi:hypothetical protein